MQLREQPFPTEALPAATLISPRFPPFFIISVALGHSPMPPGAGTLAPPLCTRAWTRGPLDTLEWVAQFCAIGRGLAFAFAFVRLLVSACRTRWWLRDGAVRLQGNYGCMMWGTCLTRCRTSGAPLLQEASQAAAARVVLAISRVGHEEFGESRQNLNP